jgi:hypothetical protein
MSNINLILHQNFMFFTPKIYIFYPLQSLYSQFHSYVLFVLQNVSKMTQLTKTQRIEILILIGCGDKTR